jgi:glycosyltransferase involved in cell wall biosynthesis
MDTSDSFDRPTARPVLRVAVVGHTAALSGGELALVRLVRALHDRVAFHVILAEDGPLIDELRRAGAAVEVLPLTDHVLGVRRSDVRLGSLPFRAIIDVGAYSLRLARRLRRLRPDLVHTNTLKAALYGGVAARLAGFPCLWHVRDRVEPGGLSALGVRLTRRAARFLPDAVVTDTEGVLETLHLPAHGPLRVVIPSIIEPLAQEHGALLQAVDGTARARPFRVAMVGRIASWKGQDVMIRALAEALPVGTAEGVIIGAPLFGEQDEVYERELRRLIEDLGLGDLVELRGYRSDLGGELVDVDVLVHASVQPEPFGQVIGEAMGLGLPVVASAAGGPLEIITDGHDGILVPPGDVAALAAVLRRLAADPDLREHLGTNARRTARRYGADVVAPPLLELYERVARTGRSDPRGVQRVERAERWAAVGVEPGEQFRVDAAGQQQSGQLVGWRGAEEV